MRAAAVRMGPAMLLAGVVATAGSGAARAGDLAVDLLWQACPFLLGTSAEVALRKLALPPDDIAMAADFACNVAQVYSGVATGQPVTPPADLRSADEIFCEGSYLAYCAGVPGAAPMSLAMRCATQQLTVEQCAVRAIRSGPWQH
ncbi:MAG: hypothetical protein ACT4OK_17150 [Gemmobacter sp.]